MVLSHVTIRVRNLRVERLKERNAMHMLNIDLYVGIKYSQLTRRKVICGKLLVDFHSTSTNNTLTFKIYPKRSRCKLKANPMLKNLQNCTRGHVVAEWCAVITKFACACVRFQFAALLKLVCFAAQ